MSENITIIADDELSLADVLRILRSYQRELLRKWWLLAIALLGTCGLAFAKYNYFNKPKYTATTSIILNNLSGGGSALGAIMGQIGLGGGGEDAPALDKMGVLAKSNKILGSALLHLTTSPAKNNIFGNYLLDTLGLGDTFKESEIPALRQFKGFTHRSIDSCTTSEWAALCVLQDYMTAKVLSTKTGQEGILTISATAKNESMVCELINNIYTELDNFYLQATAGNDVELLKQLEFKRDSISSALAGTQRSMATYTDRHQNIFQAVDQVPIAQMQQKTSILTAMSLEATRNYEMESLVLHSKKPYMTAIDLPRMPLPYDQMGFLKAIIMGVAAGLFLGVGFVVVRKIIGDAIAEANAKE